MSFPLTEVGTPGELAAEVCKDSEYLLYCNSILSRSERLRYWYQHFNLIIAIVAILLPALVWVVRRLHRLWKRRKAREQSPYITALDEKSVEKSGNNVSVLNYRPEDIVPALGLDRLTKGEASALSMRAQREQPSRAMSSLSIRELCEAERYESRHASGLNSTAQSGPGSPRTSQELDCFVFPPFYRFDARTSMTSIHMMPSRDADMAFNPLQDFDLSITPLFTRTGRLESRFSTSSRASGSRAEPRKTVIGLVHLEDLGPDAFDKDMLLDTVGELDLLRVEKGCTGLVLRIQDDVYPSQTIELIDTLCKQYIDVMIMCDTDAAILRSVDFGSLIGVILENGTILPNGQRRDFFQSDRFRETMDRCARERVERPTFFLGFNDLWEERPTAAVVRRAFKMAEFFGATLTHGQMHRLGNRASKFPISMSGFDFLKRAQIVEVQKSWLDEESGISVDAAGDLPDVAYLCTDGLQGILPSIDSLLQLCDLPDGLKKIRRERIVTIPPPTSLSRAPGRRSFWDHSSDGEELSPLGCYPLNGEITKFQYDAVLETQQHLMARKMLHTLDDVEILKLADKLRSLRGTTRYRALLESLLLGLTFNNIQVHTGLDTGFQIPGSSAHLWGMSLGATDKHIDIFISQKASSFASTVLHVYLAHHGVIREKRFEEELLLEHSIRPDARYDLPASLRTELAGSTNSELLFLIEQMKVSNVVHPFSKSIREICIERLLHDSSREAWVETHSKCFLEGSVSIRELLHLRLEEFSRRGAHKLPSLQNLERLYELVESSVSDSLFWAEREKLEHFSTALLGVYKTQGDASHRKVDLKADLFALMFFCALRKCAFENVFLETTDRCPFFLTQPDQAAVFAELWVLGSQCDIYFGILPRTLGQIVFDKYRDHLRINPPPADIFNGVDVFTAYSFSHSNKCDPPSAKHETRLSMKNHLQHKLGDYGNTVLELGALSIFCMPAVADVCLLTWLGRGFFLTAFMEAGDRLMIAYALLASLLISAANTGWVGSVGGHYLYNFAFDNMNFFFVQRLSSGFVVTMLVSICGFLAFSLQYTPRIAAVFVAYTVVICTYLNLIGILATMHRRGSPLTSGRTVLWRTIPFLFVSPIVSIFVHGHDLPIYLSILYAFLLMLLLQYRNLSHEWATWTSKVPIFKTEEVIAWYKTTTASNAELEDAQLSSDILEKTAAKALQEAVHAFPRTQKFSIKKFEDRIVAKAAEGLPFALWLLEKEFPSPDKNTRRNFERNSELFTKIWLSKVEQALRGTQQLSQGLKEHSIFVLFRYGKYDMAQSFGLFLIALMDRWVSVAMSARKATLALYNTERSRYGIGLCVLFFLISAIVVDATLQPYWEANSKLSSEKLLDSHHANIIARKTVQQRRRRWFEAILTLFTRFACVFGMTTLVVWILVKDPRQLIMYYAYVLGYTGVLTFQFNRCFTTNPRAHVMSVFASAIIGFLVGCILHGIPATSSFVYTDVLALGVASITATTLTTVWIFIDPELQAPTTVSGISENDAHPFFSQDKIGKKISRAHLATRPVQSTFVGSGVTSRDGSPVAAHITKFLKAVTIREPDPTPFSSQTPWQTRILKTASKMWQDNAVLITLSSRQIFAQAEFEDSWSLSEYKDGKLLIAAGFLDDSEIDLYRNHLTDKLALLLTETIVYHTAIGVLGFDNHHALKAERQLHQVPSTSGGLGRIEFQLATADETTLMIILRKTNAKLMKSLCLGVNTNTEWNRTPASAREAILARILGDPTPLSSSTMKWLGAVSKDIELEDFHVSLCLRIHQLVKKRLKVLASRSDSGSSVSETRRKFPAELQCKQQQKTDSSSSIFLKFVLACVQSFVIFSKWLAILSGAASEVERELWYSLQGVPEPFGRAILVVLLTFCKLCWYIKNAWITAILIFRRPTLKRVVRLARRGYERQMLRNSIIVELPDHTVTGFAWHNTSGAISLDIFNGALKQRPETDPVATCHYQGFRLHTRVDRRENEDVKTAYNYLACDKNDRIPEYKDVVDSDRTLRHWYDRSGRISRGHLSSELVEMEFDYHYRRAPKHNCDILRAVYRKPGSATSYRLTVFWSVPGQGRPMEDDMSMPSTKVTYVVKEIGEKKFVTSFRYEHKRDPICTTTLELDGQKTTVGEAPRLFDGEENLLEKPVNLSYDSEDLLLLHNPGHLKAMFEGISPDQRLFAKMHSRITSFLPFSMSYWKRHAVYHRISTWQLRAELWTLWLETNDLDAVTSCWIDELIMRQEPLLQRYWKLRNTGALYLAKEELDKNIDEIVSAIEMPFEVSQTCVLPIKPADLYTMGLGKDANQITNRPQDCYKDTKDRISVIFNDVGCWPDAPGGVSNCRRDLVNGHKTIRNHVLAESAHDYGISRFQLERNVQSLKSLPLWGLDFKTAQHGIIDNLLQSQVDEKIENTYARQDVVNVFIPTLRTFVKGSRTKHASRDELLEFSSAILTMSTYFEKKDYNKTWQSKEVETAWVDAWLQPYNNPNVLDPSELFGLERPSMEDFRDSLALYVSYFMIYSVQTPETEDCPRVFQSTHHGISSLFGMVLKYRRGATFALWDHAILWRECCLNISPAQCLLPIPVQAMLLAGIGLAARLAYLHADVLLPCTSVFNPVWEAEIGTDSGRIGSKKLFNRKIDPIANGISNMTSFEPTKEPLLKLPTVVMLSNIQTIKDIKAAVLAADHIINDFGFKTYRLHIYGAQDREPEYTMATLQLIADRNLTGKVVLAGFGNPKNVLKDAWLFVNSSLSEGLPLAIGEAALTGVPIVATEVGGTSLVLTDPDDQSRKYGEVVPPNDPMALARAQINVLAMMGEWASYTDDKLNPPVLPNNFTPDDVKRITQRMYERSEDRRQLGIKCREVVLQSFHGTRYLREHEQMYWVQWHMARMRADKLLDIDSNSRFRFDIASEIRCDIDESEEDEVGEYGQGRAATPKRYRWQDFISTASGKRAIEPKPKKIVEIRQRPMVSQMRETSLEIFRTGTQKRESTISSRSKSMRRPKSTSSTVSRVSRISRKSQYGENGWERCNV